MTSHTKYRKLKNELNNLCKVILENDIRQGILGKCSGIDKIINYFENKKNEIIHWSNRDIVFIKLLYKLYKFASSIESKLIEYMCNIQVPNPYNTIFITNYAINTCEQIIYIVSKTQRKISLLKKGTLLPLINEVYINHVKILNYMCKIFPDDVAHKILCFAYHNNVFECKIPNL